MVRFWILLLGVIGLFASCERGISGVEKGVSKALAEERKATIGRVVYTLDFSIPAEKAQPVMGESEISFTLSKLVPVILDFKTKEEKILSVYTEQGEIPYVFKNEHIIISPKYLKEGRNVLNIRFVAGDEALNRNTDFLYTLLVPDRCRVLMPCFDQPDIKAQFKLRLKVPSRWKAIANGEQIRKEAFADYDLYEFAETKPLSTYLFAFTAGRFYYHENYVNGRWIGVYHRETDTEKVKASISAITREVAYSLTWMERYTGIPYPFNVYNVVAIPSFQFGGMEHPGATYYLSSTLFLEPNADQTARLKRSEVIAHETAHMWFGDLVTMKWFDDVWLKEVFAGFMADKIMTDLYPEIDHRLKFYLNHYESALRTDRTLGAHPIAQQLDNLKDAGTLYGDIIYHKAPVVMRMLESKISTGKLKNGLRQYLRRWRYSNASWDDLITLLETSAAVDLKAWNEVWVKEKGAPVIEWNDVGIEMFNAFGERKVWPQEFSLLTGNMKRMSYLGVSVKDTITACASQRIILPDARMQGYGCFLPTEYAIRFLDENLKNLGIPLWRAQAWQLLYEGVLFKKIRAEFFIRTCIKHLVPEENNLVVNQALSFLRIVYHNYLDEGSRQAIQEEVEQFCMNMATKGKVVSNRKLYWKTLLAIHSLPTSREFFRKMLLERMTVEGVTVTDLDKLSLAYHVVLRDSGQYNSVRNYVLNTVKNRDMQERFKYVYPAVSGSKQTRDSVFQALLDVKNRTNEVWVEEALSWLNHPWRQMDSEEYISRVLEELKEIQETGDIFFPAGWLEAALSGHTSKYIYSLVNQFLEKHPDYPQNLKLKILSNSDHLRRLHAE